jgi:hypothetical protein
VAGNGETSFMGLNNNNQKFKTLSATMKKEKESFLKKLKVLERKLKEEDNQNQRIVNMRRGEYIEYGNEVILLHVDSNCFLSAMKQCADEDNSCNKVELVAHGSKAVFFKTLGGFKYKKEGDKIHYNDQIVLLNLKFELYLHVTERTLKIKPEDEIPDSLKKGISIVTPKKIDRREPP